MDANLGAQDVSTHILACVYMRYGHTEMHIVILLITTINTIGVISFTKNVVNEFTLMVRLISRSR